MTGDRNSKVDFRDLAGGQVPSVGDADLCLRNAERLLGDAARASPETRLMLTELAIEEAAKGILIHWRMDIQNLLGGPREAASRFELLAPEAKAILVEFGDGLGDHALQEAFRTHNLKIAHLQFLAEVFEREVHGGQFSTWRPGSPYSDETVRALARIGEIPAVAEQGKAETARLVEVLGRVVRHKKGELSLSKLRERATYVDAPAETSDCRYPVANTELSTQLSEVATFLVRTLTMASIIRRDHHRASR